MYTFIIFHFIDGFSVCFYLLLDATKSFQATFHAAENVWLYLFIVTETCTLMNGIYPSVCLVSKSVKVVNAECKVCPFEQNRPNSLLLFFL